jgi:DNA-3-methyladenine glycosylase I
MSDSPQKIQVPKRIALAHRDGLHRCPWPGHDPAYLAYHDEEWGVPEFESRALFEKLLLDGFQAGLSWISILRKRQNFRSAFENFDPQKIAAFDAPRVESLMQDAGIIRNRAKITGAIASARLYLDIEAKQGFANYLWDFLDGRTIVNHFQSLEEVPAQTPLSEQMARDLKSRGFKFCGPTIIYAFMQAVGMVNDHLVACHRHAACEVLSQKAGRG